jgi:purine nucleosidase
MKFKPYMFFELVILLSLIISGYPNKASNFNGLTPLPQKVILDADMDSDVDDVGALALALNLHKERTIDLIGVIVTSDDPYAPVCADAINTYFGFSEIPVGFLAYPPTLRNHSRYTKTIANEFPSRLGSWEDAEEGVRLYRKLLANSPGESVVIVTVGHLSTLMGLLRSPPDELSPLSGPELVKEKVKKWICMGGRFPHGKEANFYRPDPYSTNYCIDNWEKEIIFYGWDIGNLAVTGGSRLRDMLTASHPVFRSYELYNNFAGRASWDQLAMLELTDHAKIIFSYVRGRVIVAPDGSNTWEDDISGNHKYVEFHPAIDVDKVSKFIDQLMAGTLSSKDFF